MGCPRGGGPDGPTPPTSPISDPLGRIAAPSVGTAVSGEFVKLDRHRHLAMTWLWEDADGVEPAERVDVDPDAVGDDLTQDLDSTGPGWAQPG